MNVEIPPLSLSETDLALPEILRSELDGLPIRMRMHRDVFVDGPRLELAGRPLYALRDWQYFLLFEALGPGRSRVEELQALVIERYGVEPSEEEIRDLFLDLLDLSLIDVAQADRHPLARKLVVGEPSPKNEVVAAKAGQVPVAAGGQKKRAGIRLFRPMRLLRIVRPLFSVGSVLLVALPPMLVISAFILFQNWATVATAFELQYRSPDFLTFLLLGLLTVNAVAMTVYACAAYEFGATVDGVVLRFYLGFIPRLGLWVEDTEKLSRRQAMWLHASPLLARLFVATGALLLWSSTRHLGSTLTELMLSVAAIAILSAVVTACPFYRSHGYNILVQFLDEPNLRAKAAQALLNAFNSGYYQNIDRRILIAYAMVSLLFTATLVIVVFLMLKGRLEFQIGSTAYLVAGILLVAFARKVWAQLAETNRVYWQNYRFERWRERTLPSEEQKRLEKKTALNPWRVIRIMLLTALAIALLQPYPYRPSGSVTMLPAAMQELSTETDGIVDAIYYDGGEFLEKGTVIAKLATDDTEAELKVYEAQRREALIERDYAQANCEREERLFASDAIAEAQYQRTATLCAQAAANIETIDARIERLRHRIDRAMFVMPFDGQLGTLYLNDRLGSFLEAGEPIATVRDTSSFRVRLQIREVDLALVEVGDPVEVRVYGYPNEVFEGEVIAIDPDVEDTTSGRLVEMVASVQNRDGLLRSGMSGQAKAGGTEMKVWEILSQTVIRFFTIDLWAWLP